MYGMMAVDALIWPWGASDMTPEGHCIVMTENPVEKTTPLSADPYFMLKAVVGDTDAPATLTREK